MQLPQSIRVGYRTFTVRLIPPREAEADGHDGYCDKLNGVIGIREDLDPIETLATLWHELRHAVYKVACIGDGASEETIASTFGNFDVEIWIDNPEFLAFMHEAIGRESA